MFLSEHVSELYDRWEVFNDRTLRKIPLPGGFRWDVTGRLVSGLIGFGIFVSLLCVHFAIAEYDTSPLGGGHIFEVETSSEANEVFNQQNTVNEGDVIDYTLPDMDENRKILRYEVRFNWNNVDTDVGAPDVKFELWSSNASRDPLIFTETAFQGTYTTDWIINNHTLLNNASSTFTVAAETEAQVLSDLERDGETLFARATYVDDNNPSPVHLAERLDFRLTVTLVEWKLNDIDEVG